MKVAADRLRIATEITRCAEHVEDCAFRPVDANAMRNLRVKFITRFGPDICDLLSCRFGRSIDRREGIFNEFKTALASYRYWQCFRYAWRVVSVEINHEAMPLFGASVVFDNLVQQRPPVFTLNLVTEFAFVRGQSALDKICSPDRFVMSQRENVAERALPL